jgi:hypothetical protein
MWVAPRRDFIKVKGVFTQGGVHPGSQIGFHLLFVASGQQRAGGMARFYRLAEDVSILRTYCGRLDALQMNWQNSAVASLAQW